MKADKETLHILVAEDLPILQGGIISLLEHITSVHVHAVAIQSLQTLYNLSAVRTFDFLFVSPHFNGGFDLAEFRKRYPQTPCIAIVNNLGMLSEVKGYYRYITIYDDADKVSRLIEQYQADCTEAPLDSPPDQLSSREKEILIELVKGLSNKEVSDRLCLSVYTVMTHRRNICRKLKIHSLSGLTIYALSNKLIDM